MAKIKSLYVYPVKSCKGISLDSVVARPAGFKYDREWMIINSATGKMLTQRTHPQMTQIECVVGQDFLTISFGNKSFDIPFSVGEEVFDSDVWKNQVKGVRQSVDGFETALGEFLQTEAILLHFTGNRKVASKQIDVAVDVMYADGYPYTIADVADLDLLNNYFQQKGLPVVSMQRFRANIVLEGVVADVGSNNKKFVIETATGAVAGEFCEPCTRCPMPDLDPETGIKTNHQMQRSLKDMRGVKKDWFSTNSILNITEEVVISVGDSVVVG